MTALRDSRSQESWRTHAACRGAPTDVFFVSGEDTYEDEQYYLTPEQRAYCAPCPVRNDCLQHALDNNEVGIWGNTTDYQRRQLRRRVGERSCCPGCSSRDLVIEGTAELCLACGQSWYAF